MLCSVSEKRGMHEFAYFSIGGLPTKSGSTASAASQYSLRDLHVNIMLNPHAATQVRMSSYERQTCSNPKGRVVDHNLANRKLRRSPLCGTIRLTLEAASVRDLTQCSSEPTGSYKNQGFFNHSRTTL